MVTVTLPDAWLLVAPCGCIDGIRHAVINGEIICATAEDAWASFTPRKRDRDREAREGYTLVAGTAEDWDRSRAGCIHEPQWQKPTPSGARTPEEG